jgi:dienelactone hydrolase
MLVRALFLLLLWATAAAADPAERLDVPTEYQGKPIVIHGTFEKPSSSGPIPVVILLHGCGGMHEITALPNWAQFLHQLGYATFYPDSFTPRGVNNDCDKSSLFGEQARDAFAAANALSARPDVLRSKIAVLGQSHGGAAIVRYIARDRPEFRPLRAGLAPHGANIVSAVAISPNCDPSDTSYPVVMPLLILMGALDDWTPVASCTDLARAPGAAANVQMKVYPGAYHLFDLPMPPLWVSGHRLEYNQPAAEDARVQVQSFFARTLH